MVRENWPITYDISLLKRPFQWTLDDLCQRWKVGKEKGGHAVLAFGQLRIQTWVISPKCNTNFDE